MAEEYLIGIEIGGTKLQMVKADLALQLNDRVTMQVSEERNAESIIRQITQGLETIMGGKKPAAIGVGFGGPVDYKTGKIVVSHQISGWNGFNLREWLEELSGAPVCVDNDANVAALGEALGGEGKLYEKVFYMTIGSGIGGGMVINRKIYHGDYPGEVEVGHLRLSKSGDTLESRCSGWAIDEQVRMAVRRSPDSLLTNLVGKATKGEAAFLKAALLQGDASAIDILDEASDNLAFALSHVVHLLHPEIIILGGGISMLGEELSVRVAVALPRYLMTSFCPGPPVRIAALKEDAVPLGALQMALGAMNDEW